MKADLETFHILMPPRFSIVCLVFLAQILATEITLIIKGRYIGAGKLVKQGFIRTQKPPENRSALLKQTVKSTGLGIETFKYFLIDL